MQTRAAQDTTIAGERVVDVEVAPYGERDAAGLTFDRYFTRAGRRSRSTRSNGSCARRSSATRRGEVVFEQRDVEIPKFWSQQATNIVVSKYFRGQIGTPERERRVKQLIGRVVDTITEWARAPEVLRERRRTCRRSATI